MGKTSKPLHLVVHPTLWGYEDLITLKAQGHIVELMPPIWVSAILLGPFSWRMTEAHIPYLELALKEARRVMYPKEEQS